MWEILRTVAFLLAILATLVLIVIIMFKHVRDLHRLLTGGVPAVKIARFLLFGIVLCAILAPLLFYEERKSPLHLEIKPAAEDRVRSNAAAKELIGDPISFGFERSFSSTEQGENGSGELSFPVRGSKGKGTVQVTAVETAGHWHPDSIVLVVKDKQISIPVE